MTLKHCQPRQKEASTAVEKTCKHTKHKIEQISSTPTQATPRIIIIISSTVGDKSATTNQHCNFPFVTLKAFSSGPLLTSSRGSRINATTFKINYSICTQFFFSLQQNPPI